jgi:hypothetical protein
MTEPKTRAEMVAKADAFAMSVERISKTQYRGSTRATMDGFLAVYWAVRAHTHNE